MPDYISAENIEDEGGIVEFAQGMTYGEFLDLKWDSSIDHSLSKESEVYVIKIYYPKGYDHIRIGKIKNCEAIGVYKADTGELSGASYKERK